MKRIAVLGSTGPVGRQTLDVVRAFPDKLQVLGLAADTNLRLLARQVKEFQPELVCHPGEVTPTPLPASVRGKLVSMEELAAHPQVDLVIVATESALAGLPGTLAALKAGKPVALANEEALLVAGGLLMDAAKKHNAPVLPVQGALSALWQCLRGEPSAVKRVILATPAYRTRLPDLPTGQAGGQAGRSGGPPVSHDPQVGAQAARSEAPEPFTRPAGVKARINSMTLMATGMEAIAVNRLFGVHFDNIEVIIHPESVIRALVECLDGSVKAVLSRPRLHSSLQYALSFPERWRHEDAPLVNPAKLGRLTFHPVDLVSYPCLEYALKAGRIGGTAPAVLNAANETAVCAFSRGQIGLPELPKVMASVLGAHAVVEDPALEDIVAADAWAREQARKHICLTVGRSPPEGLP